MNEPTNMAEFRQACLEVFALQVVDGALATPQLPMLCAALEEIITAVERGQLTACQRVLGAGLVDLIEEQLPLPPPNEALLRAAQRHTELISKNGS